MSRKKTPQLIKKPFTHVHNTLTTLGFTEISAPECCMYEIILRDPMSNKAYVFQLPTKTTDNGHAVVYLHEADFKDQTNIPDSAVAVARQMMSEVEQYLSSYEKKQAGTPIDKATNGRMATTEAELKRLGKEMNKMPTNAQVIQSGMVPDPIQ
jgi:hypothetical protein